MEMQWLIERLIRPCGSTTEMAPDRRSSRLRSLPPPSAWVIGLVYGGFLALAGVADAAPGILYSTYLGGSNNEADIPIGASNVAIAVDALGNRYVTGTTSSADFPTTPGADRTLDGPLDFFVTKLAPDGSIVYSTYLGGPCKDIARDIAVDGFGNAYVTGRTGSDCPFGGTSGVLVAKLDPAGNLVYASVFGGTLADLSTGQAIAVDALGQAYVAGTVLTSSNDFPTTPGAYRTQACPNSISYFADGFVAKLAADGGSLVYSTIVCGSGDDSPGSLAIDTSGSAYVGGTTGSKDFPTVSALQPANLTGPVGITGFLFKLNPDGSDLAFSTYLGGSTGDRVNGLAIDAQRNVFLTGETESDDFPTTPGVIQPIGGNTLCIQSCSEAFVAKIAASGSRLLYSTYLRGDLDDSGRDVVVDEAGRAHVVGITSSLYFPVVGAFQRIDRGLTDAFVTTLSPGGSRILFSSYLGGRRNPANTGEGWDDGRSIALDVNGDLHVAGYTESYDLPTTPGAPQPTLGGGTCDYFGSPCGDAFVTTISPSANTPVPPVIVDATPSMVAPGGTLQVGWSGIAAPTESDQLRVCGLGKASDSTCELFDVWSTGGNATGALEIVLPASLPPGWYDVRLMSPDADSFGILKPIGRSDPILLPFDPPDSAIAAASLFALAQFARRTRSKHAVHTEPKRGPRSTRSPDKRATARASSIRPAWRPARQIPRP